MGVHDISSVRRIVLGVAWMLTAFALLFPLEYWSHADDKYLWRPLPVVLGSSVVDRQIVSMAFLSMSVVAWLVWIVWSANHPRLGRRWSRGVRVSATTVVVLLIMFDAFTYALAFIGIESFQILQPSSPDGCRVIVSESSGMWSSYGRFLVAESGEVVPHDTGKEWSHVDGSISDPFGAVRWTLEWHGDEAVLRPDRPDVVRLHGGAIVCSAQ